MKILFLADAVFEDIPGGSRVAARELAAGLTSRGHSVTFLVGRHKKESPGDETVNGIRIVRYDGAGQGTAFVRSGQRAAQALIDSGEKFDILHTHFAYAAVGPLKAFKGTVPHVRTFHGPWDEEALFEDLSRARSPVSKLKAVVKSRMCWKIEKDNLKVSKAVITLSDCFKQKIRQRYGLGIDNVTIIPGGADLDRFVPAADKSASRQSLGLPTDRPILFSVRRLAPRMGLDNLIAAMPDVMKATPNVLLLIGGKGPQKQLLEAMITKHGLMDNVRLIGFIPDSDLVTYYQSADLFVLPTTALEGFGLVTTESLACGVPVIGTPIGGTVEILNGLDKRLVANGVEPVDLATAVNSFLGGTWSSALTVDRLRHYACTNYSWPRHVEAVEEIYSSLTALAKANPA